MTDFVTGRFRRLVEILIGIEGGAKITNRKNDRGGLTKFGISQRSYPTLDIRRLTRDDAVQIYHKDFWMPVRGDEFAAEKIAQLVFEFGVNAGPGTAAKALQRALNGLGRPLSVDGRIGRATIAAANAAQPDALAAAFRREAADHYARIIAHDPTQQENANGWANRIKEREGG